ncbi:fucose-specific lectin [Hypoxylon sp. FL0543]|nr:fucose-specific lectin [Hypoxylon sp. FL0543]
MASTGYHHGQFDQPGLEVAQHDPRYESGIQVAPSNQDGLHPVQAEKEYTQGYPGVGEIIAAPKRRNPKKIILIAIGCALIIAGVVVGAVVGTQKSKASSSSSPAPTVSSSGQGDNPQSDGEAGPSQAEMTGSPTSVAPGLAPTAISWGYPHMEIFALTNNDTYSIYRKYRNSNASLQTDFIPRGTGMELVGGGIDTNSAPSIAVNHRIDSGRTNRTELHINGKGGAYRKYHDADQLWANLDPNIWDVFENAYVISAPAEVQYEPSVGVMKISGPDLQPMAPAVVAWNRNDTRVDIFAVSRANSHLLTATWEAETANWSDYKDLHGFITTPPVAVSRSPGIIDVFARGGDAGLWHISYDDGNKSWTDWTRLGTKIEGQPDAISATSDTLDVFAWGQDGSMLHKSFDSASGSWTPKDEFEVLVKGTLSGPPRAMSDAPGNIHIFAYNDDNELIWKRLGSAAQSSDVVTLANVPMVSTGT